MLMLWNARLPPTATKESAREGLPETMASTQPRPRAGAVDYNRTARVRAHGRNCAAWPRRSLGAWAWEVAHGGAVLVPAGLSRLENLVTGYDEGSVALEDGDAPPFRLAATPFSIGRSERPD